MSQNSPSYSPRLTRSHTCCVLLAHTRRVLSPIVLAAGTLIDIVLVTLYCTTSHCLSLPELCKPCHKARHHTRRVLLAIILAASYLLSSSPPAPSLTSYSPCLRCTHTRHGLLAIVPTAGTLIDIILVSYYLLSFSPPTPSLIWYLSRCIAQLPAVCHSENCSNDVTKVAIILATSYLLSS